MEVKTESGGTFDAAGSGTKGIAIAGLVAGATALVGSGLLGMWANTRGPCNGNWNNYGNGGNCGNFGNYGNYGNFGFNHCRPVCQEEFEQQKNIDILNSEIAKIKAERYADQAVIAGNEKFYNFRKDLADAIVEDRNRLSNIEGKMSCNEEISRLKEKIMLEKLENVRNEAIGAVKLESERRINGDQGLYSYVNATFVPGRLVMPRTSICPEVMQRYNSWTAPTDTAETTTVTN